MVEIDALEYVSYLSQKTRVDNFMCGRIEMTYTDPTDIKAKTSSLVWDFMFVFQSSTPGNTAHAISVMMVVTVAVWLIPIIAAIVPHRTLGSVWSKLVFQLASMGEQKSRTPMKVTRNDAQTRPSRRYSVMRTAFRVLPMRHIMTQMDDLICASPIT